MVLSTKNKIAITTFAVISILGFSLGLYSLLNMPNQVQKYVTAHRAELKGEKGDTGFSGAFKPNEGPLAAPSNGTAGVSSTPVPVYYVPNNSTPKTSTHCSTTYLGSYAFTNCY